uniref:Uncharacterized protein n=1 Tax=Rhizophora mucronata TaxID=61149 RepID=A0A2P2QQS2_RHIMU
MSFQTQKSQPSGFDHDCLSFDVKIINNQD